MFARIAKKLWSPISTNRTSSKTNRQAAFARLNVEALEARNVLTSTLYIRAPLREGSTPRQRFDVYVKGIPFEE